MRKHVYTFIRQARNKMAEQPELIQQPGNFLESLLVQNEYAGKRNSWLQHAEMFNPQQWLYPELHQPHSPETLIPFGSGPRFCPGRQLALMEIKASIAMICHYFEWQMVTPLDDIKENLSFVVKPSAYSIQLKPFSGSA